MSRPFVVVARFTVYAVAAVALTGCDFSVGPFDWDLCANNTQVVSRIRLKPSEVSVRVNQQTLVTYELLTSDGTLALCGGSPTFSIDDPTVATSSGGVVRGISVGQTTLRASMSGTSVSTSAVVTVTTDSLASLDVTVSNAALLVGQVTEVSALAQYVGGIFGVLQITPWISDNPEIASVTNGGTVVARGVGTATIRVTSGGLTASTSISIDTGPPSIPMVVLSAGGDQSCALAAGGSVPAGTAFCWGFVGGTSGQRSPVRVPGTLVFRSISAGTSLACGISTSGESYCWGWNSSGELGIGNRTANFSPQRVSGNPTYVSVVASDGLACGLLATGRAHCWGGTNGGDALLVPTPLAGALTFVELTAGGLGPGVVCGRTAGGDIYCWGRFVRWHVVAPQLAVSASAFTSLSVGSQYSCGLRANGAAWCWGTIRDQLGAGVVDGNYAAPVAVPGGLTFQSVAATSGFFCGITDDGTWCHGSTGLLKSTGASTAPSRVPMLDPHTQFVRISGGSSHACALDTRGAVWCWGPSSVLGLPGITRPPEPLQLRFE